MKNFLTLALAITALAFFGSDNASAQGFNNGFLFGSGINQAGGRRSGGFTAPPYFAQFPPVYYSGIVRRPYGISPYAAPAGIEPVEFRHQRKIVPVTIRNPYMQNIEPASGPTIKTEPSENMVNKTT